MAMDDRRAAVCQTMSDKTITIICIALPVICVVFSIILIFLEQAAQEAEMFEKKKREAK